ncbi:hypothetical protein SUGI_0904970 [Cryptomeria japonica]|nr:hypothetical protein SUGI_0904970 [Cryptomeria japonica]
MEFVYEGRICGVPDLCADSMAETDAEETLSFCDMLLYDSAGTVSTERVSNADCSDHHEFLFDLAFEALLPWQIVPLLLTICSTKAAFFLSLNAMQISFIAIRILSSKSRAF